MTRRGGRAATVEHPLPAGAGELVGAALWRWRAAVALLHGVLLGPFALNALFRPSVFPSLYLWHAARIETTFSSPFEPGEAHFLWAATSKLVNTLVGAGDVRVGAAIVTVAAYMFVGVCVFEVFRQLDDGPLVPWGAAAASVFIALLEAPAALQGWTKIADPDTSFLTLHMPFLPTSIAASGFNVLLVWYCSRLLMGQLRPGPRRWIPVLVVAAALAKPNLVAPLTAAVTAVSAWAHFSPASPWGMQLDRRSFPAVARLLLLPALAVTLFQDYLLRYRNYEAIRGSWVLSPLTELQALGAFSWQFWLVLLFPLLALVMLRARLVGDVAVAVSFGALAVGLVASLLLERSNPTYKGDVVQLCQAAAAVLMVFVSRRVVTLWRQGCVRGVVAVTLALALVPYALAGAATWRCHSGAATCYPDVTPPEWPQPRIDGE